MATYENDEFSHGASEFARMRREKQLHLRASGMGLGVAGLGYGISSYGSPMGAVTSVQQPVLGAGVSATTAPPVSPMQFAGITTAAPAGDSGTSGTATAAASTGGAAV